MDESWRPILRLFRISPASKEQLMLFLIIAFIIILSLILIQFITYFVRRKRRNIEQWDWFYRMCEAKDLSVEEMKLLRDMIKKTKLRNPAVVFKSMKAFDRCVNTEFKTTDLTDEKREELAEDIAEIRRKLLFDRFTPGKVLESSRGINPAQRLRLGFKFDGKRHFMHTWVLDVKEDAILVYIPELEGEGETFSKEQEVDVYFWRDADAGYSFSTTIQDVQKEPVGILYLNHSENLHRTQRRHFYRLDISLPLKFRIITDEQILELREKGRISFPKDNMPKDGEVKSISGGGAAFISEIFINNDQVVWLEISLSKSWWVSDIYGKVLQCKKIMDNEYKIFVEFQLIEDNVRDEIIRFVSEKQREKVKM